MHNQQDPFNEEERLIVEKEKRSSARKPTCSYFTLSIDKAAIEGAGSNISQTGAYFVTCDEIPVELVIRCKDKEKKVGGWIKRIDQISEGSKGVAIQFDRRLTDC